MEPPLALEILQCCICFIDELIGLKTIAESLPRLEGGRCYGMKGCSVCSVFFESMEDNSVNEMRYIFSYYTNPSASSIHNPLRREGLARLRRERKLRVQRIR